MTDLARRNETSLLRPSEARTLAVALKRGFLERGRTGQLVVWDSTFARAYVYNGQWIAECPQKCGGAELLMSGPDRKDVFYCSYCTCMATSIQWPPNADEIMDVLNRRPLPHNRNWYPEGHVTALAAGVRDGETIEELRAENAAHGID